MYYAPALGEHARTCLIDLMWACTRVFGADSNPRCCRWTAAKDTDAHTQETRPKRGLTVHWQRTNRHHVCSRRKALQKFLVRHVNAGCPLVGVHPQGSLLHLPASHGAPSRRAAPLLGRHSCTGGCCRLVWLFQHRPPPSKACKEHGRKRS